MSTDAIYSESYKGHTINIYSDYGTESPEYWRDDSFLVHYHRDCLIENTAIKEDDLRRWYQGEKIEQQNKYHIFAVSAYIHSGIRLSLESTFPSDSYGWDTSHVGAVLVKKTDAKTKAAARKEAILIVEIWNDYLSNNVYGFTIDDDGDSCWGFYGDYDSPGDGSALYAAREAVDRLVERERKEHNINIKK